LAVPGLLFWINILNAQFHPDNIVAPPSPDVASNPGETTIPDVTASPENTDTKNWTAITPDEIDIVKSVFPKATILNGTLLKTARNLIHIQETIPLFLNRLINTMKLTV